VRGLREEKGDKKGGRKAPLLAKDRQYTRKATH